MIINEVCGGNENSAPKNTGTKNQCTPKPVIESILAKETFSFADLATMKTRAAWDAALAAKNIAPIYKVEEIAANNTEAKKYEGRFKDVTLKEAIKGVNYSHLLSDCSHATLKSYEGSEYTRIFRVCEDGTVHCEVMDDGKIMGEPLSSYNVGELIESTDDKPQNAEIQLKFKEYSKSTIELDFDIIDYEGIYDVTLTVAAATATSIKVSATAGCNNTSVTSFEDGDFVVKDGAGAVQSVTFVPFDTAEGVYELTGTGFATGFTVELNDVVAQSTIMYEGVAPVAITV